MSWDPTGVVVPARARDRVLQILHAARLRHDEYSLPAGSLFVVDHVHRQQLLRDADLSVLPPPSSAAPLAERHVRQLEHLGVKPGASAHALWRALAEQHGVDVPL